MKDNDLSGSISEIISIEFDTVVLQKQNDWLRILYRRQVDAGFQNVVNLSMDTNGLFLKVGSTVKEQLFLERVALSRQMGDDSRFPNVTKGHILFEEYDFVKNGQIEGQFTIEFEDGRNLLGNFKGPLEEVDIKS